MVETQCRIALPENADAPKRADLFGQVELAPMFGNHDRAGGQEVRGAKKF